MAALTAAILGAAALGSAKIASDASKKAVNAQTQALQSASDIQQAQYDQTRADQAPWKDVGTQALDQMAKLYGIQVHDINGNVTGGATTAGTPDMSGFTASPDYQFRYNEGQRAVEADMAQRGALDSGAEKKALQDRGQQTASQEYGDFFNRLATMAGYGTSANAATQQAGQTAANNISNNTVAAGNAQASGYIDRGNTYSSALQNITGVLTGQPNLSQPAALGSLTGVLTKYPSGSNIPALGKSSSLSGGQRQALTGF